MGQEQILLASTSIRSNWDEAKQWTNIPPPVSAEASASAVDYFHSDECGQKQAAYIIY